MYTQQDRTEEDPKVPPTLARAMPKKVPPSSPFGERLLRLRRDRGLTQVQLAELIDSTQRAISSYETVLDFPPTHVVIELARALGVSADELLGLRAPKTRHAAVPEDPEARRLWKKFQLVLSLPEKDRRAVIRLVNSLVSSNTRHRQAS
jgi:transcriptional regulator with XRE-family HTH domain